MATSNAVRASDPHPPARRRPNTQGGDPRGRPAANSPGRATRAPEWTEIAAQTRTTKRMIYYYFGGKEPLFIAALERAYAGVRDRRTGDRRRAPGSVSRRSAGSPRRPSTTTTPIADFIRLVSIENIHRAEHMGRSDGSAALAPRAIDSDREDPRRGRARRPLHAEGRRGWTCT